jgi:putative ABC transport system permease protein
MHEWARAVRRLMRRPASAAAIVVTVALGIGISAGMFSVLHGVVLRALPYPDADRLVRIYTGAPSRGPGRGGLTRAEVLEGLPDLPGFESTAYYVNEPPYLFNGAGLARRVGVVRVSADFFTVFGVPAALGRTFIAADFAEAGPVAVLSHEAWTELTGGDSSAVGRTLTFTQASVEVVGVLPPSFTESTGEALVYVPFSASDLGAPRFLYGQRQIVAVGRLAAGTSRAAARNALAARMAEAAEDRRPDDFQYTFVGLLDELVAGVRVALSGLFTVSLLVLLIACATAASLVAIRFHARGTELGLHRALGASNARIAADLARELVLLASAACVGGVLIARFVLAALRPLVADTLPRAEGIAIDAATLGFAAAAAAATVLLTGAASLAALRSDPGRSLRPGARQLVASGRKPALLPIAAVGMASVALAAALALSVSLAELRNVPTGFRTQNVVALNLAFVSRTPAEMYQGVDRVLEQLTDVPGVAGATAAFGAPTSLVLPRAGARLQTDGERTAAIFQQVSENYHGLLGVPILRGRDITAADIEGVQHVAVVNQTLARTMFGDRDPLGQTLVLATGTEPVVIVGVAADRNNAGLRAPPDPEVVVPLRQWGTPPSTLLVRWENEPPAAWRTLLRDVVSEADPQQLVVAGFALTDELNSQTRALRLFAFATNAFAVFALLLCGFGINAVIAAAQQRRAREIGLRMALGATPRQASALVLATAARIAAPGVIVAALLAVPVFRWLRPQLFDVGEASLWLLFAVAVLVSAAAALTAALFPARRAAHIAPMEALRYE